MPAPALAVAKVDGAREAGGGVVVIDPQSAPSTNRRECREGEAAPFDVARAVVAAVGRARALAALPPHEARVAHALAVDALAVRAHRALLDVARFAAPPRDAKR